MQAFVKFFGQADNRSPRDRPVLDTVRTSGSHRICTYPRGRRPRAVRSGDLKFMGHLVSGPNDIAVYGRGIARAHEEGRDDASSEDISRRPWLARWSHFIRIRDTEFVDGTLANGISLNELMDELGPYAFGPTAENADRGDRQRRPAYVDSAGGGDSAVGSRGELAGPGARSRFSQIWQAPREQARFRLGGNQ